MSLKSELKNGAVVECRNGNRYIKIDNILLGIGMLGIYIKFDKFDDNLLCRYGHNFDIVKLHNNVNNCIGYCSRSICETTHDNKWTWERPAEILDKKEKEYLSAVIKPFRDRIKHIVKGRNSFGESIAICMSREMDVFLPYFKTNTMYKGMEAGKKYTLEELEL